MGVSGGEGRIESNDMRKSAKKKECEAVTMMTIGKGGPGQTKQMGNFRD